MTERIPQSTVLALSAAGALVVLLITVIVQALMAGAREEDVVRRAAELRAVDTAQDVRIRNLEQWRAQHETHPIPGRSRLPAVATDARGYR